MGFLREAVINHVNLQHRNGNEARAEELSMLPPRIPVSQIGHCPRQAIYEAVRYHPDHPLHADPTHGFDDYVKEIMECGNVWEPESGKALAVRYGALVHWRRGDPVLRVGDANWSGHMDFLVEPCEDFPMGALIEHKATNPVNFARKDRLPYQFHCMQVLTYERLLRLRPDYSNGVPVYLYYRSWNNWAELMVWDDGKYLIWEGEINGKSKSGEIEMEYSLDDTIRMLTETWTSQELPPRYNSPVEHIFTCAKVRDGMGYPNCRYFGACWPELPQHGGFDIEGFKK